MCAAKPSDASGILGPRQGNEAQAPVCPEDGSVAHCRPQAVRKTIGLPQAAALAGLDDETVPLEMRRRSPAGRLAADSRLSQDALILQFTDGLALELRFASPEEYAINRVWGRRICASTPRPCTPTSPPFPTYDHEDTCRADPLAVPGREPWENAERVLQALLADPLLEKVAR